MKFSKSNLQKLEEILEKIGFKVRYEKGNFNSGYCLVEQKKIIVVNKFYDVEGRIQILLEVLQSLEIEEQNLDVKELAQLKGFLRESI